MKQKTLQQDGINTKTGLYVDRKEFLGSILDVLASKQHVVLSSPPATGKTSVLKLLSQKLEDENERVFRCIPKISSDKMLTLIESWGVPTADLNALEKVERCWIFVDDAQRGYGFDALWEFLVKDVACNPNIKVVIAATHDFSTLGSPASIGLLPHVFFNFSGDEIADLIIRFCSNFEIDMNQNDWIEYWDVVMELSLIDTRNDQAEFHVGVVLRCMIELERLRKVPTPNFNGKSVQANLRKLAFIQGFDRCFAIDSSHLADSSIRENITDLLTGSFKMDNDCYVPDSLFPMVRAGILTLEGNFTCQAAHWFYNTVYFPSRAQKLPKDVNELVVNAVQLLSASRLRGCVQGGQFPVETSFQHLFDGVFNCLLPTAASLKPEYRTKAPGFLGDPQRGFIDFYVNDNVQWAIELLVLSRGLTEHRNRFHPLTGKYRTLPTKQMLVVNICGQQDSGVQEARDNLCVLYFSSDWTRCSIQMEKEAIKEVQLQL